MDIGTLHGVWTLLLIFIFVGIVVWAWRGDRRADFERAGRIPLDDDGPPSTRSR